MRVICYRLINPALLVEKALLIRRIIFPVADSAFDGSNIRFDISPYTGFITFFNYNLLWQTTAETFGPLNEVKKAEQFATDFLKNIRDRTATELNLQKAGIPSLFPSRSKYDHLETVSVMHPENGIPDHWLSRFGISLRVEFSKSLASSTSSDETDHHEDDAEKAEPAEIKIPSSFYAPVLFAAVEVRTTFKGEIIGLNIRWRPFDKVARPDFTFLEHHAEETSTVKSNSSSHSDDLFNKDKIVFVLDTVEAPAMFLAPYYFITDEGHHGGLEAASEYSLVVDIFQKNQSDGAVLSPLVKGGSGNYGYHWGKWQIDKVSEEGIKYLGQSMDITVELGVYNIILDVEDRKTHQVKRFEKMIYAKGLEENISI